VTPSTRPRIEFDESGTCNACSWHRKKQTEINWNDRIRQIAKICDRFRGRDYFDCIVPCSGGKDGSYVAWRLKHDFGMNPLCITFMPQMQTRIGWLNLENFKSSGFDHLTISPNPQTYREFAKDSFIARGMPKQPFVVGISTALLRYARMFRVKLIVYGEQGEVEYGGKQETETLQKFSRDFLISTYYEGQDPSKYGYWWQVPEEQKFDDIYATWWSLYEDWDPEIHARLAKNKCGFEMLVGGSIGTFTNYAQLDDTMQDLHAYLMFLKFGFGRCTSDASIEIRRGRLSRSEGVNLVNKLDGLFPVEYLDAYCDYLNMTEKGFFGVCDSFANKDLLERTDKPERPWILKNPCV
jgi:N-acetyl sugar amidotransferase